MSYRATLAVLAVVLMATPIYADQLRHHVVAPGGLVTGTGTQLTLVVGQSLIGRATGPTQAANYGYLWATRAFHINRSTVVLISSFDASIDKRTVSLEWEIADAFELQGFNIYRSETGEENDFVRINSRLLSGDAAYQYVDDAVAGEKQYWYRLGAIDRDGEFFSAPANVNTPVWNTELDQNFPNPFNPTTTIRFYLAAESRVSLRIYDVRGAVVTDLVDAQLPVGQHEFVWDGVNRNSSPVASGMYFYRLIAGKRSYTKKMMLLK